MLAHNTEGQGVQQIGPSSILKRFIMIEREKRAA